MGLRPQEDPIGFAAGDLNLSRYVWNSPLSWTDPSGLAAAGSYGRTATATSRGTASAARVGLQVACQLYTTAMLVDAASQGEVLEVLEISMDYALGMCRARVAWKRGGGGGCGCSKGGGGGKRSFPAGVAVWTEEGYLNVEDVSVGDVVWSHNTETGERELKPVVDVFSRVASGLVTVGYVGSDGEQKPLQTTAEHPFAVLGSSLLADGGWVEAASLTVGDVILDVDGGTGVRVASVTHQRGAVTVYNFEVEGNHNYFVEDDGLLTHNAGGRLGKVLGCVLLLKNVYSDAVMPGTNKGNNGLNKPSVQLQRKPEEEDELS